MQHYALFLQGFNYSIKYRKSELHANADCLSRLPIKDNDQKFDVVDIFHLNTIETLPITITDLRKATENDVEFSKLHDALVTGRELDECDNLQIDMREFTLQNGIIFRGHRAVIPQPLRNKILQELHTGHFGIIRMKNLARGYVWWPSIDKDIESLAKNCNDCNTFRNNPTKIDVHAWEPSSTAFEQVHVNFAGPFLGHYFFVLIDAYTKWPEVHIVKNTISETTIELCRQIFATFGIPKYFVSDNAKTFTSTEFKTFLKVNGIIQKLTAPYHSATNGQAERFVQTLKNSLRRMRSNTSNTHVMLQQILIQYRNTTRPATGKSPAELMFARNLRTRLDLLLPTENEYIENEHVPTFFNVGKRVSCRNYVGKDKWIFRNVIERIGKLLYKIKLDDGRIWKKHVNQIRAIGKNTPAKLTDCVIFSDAPIVDNTPAVEFENPVQQVPPVEPERIQGLHQQIVPEEAPAPQNSPIQAPQVGPAEGAAEPVVATPKRTMRPRNVPKHLKDYEVQFKQTHN